jgi:3-phosphoshikimate 1-carboxyvinyltransferase
MNPQIKFYPKSTTGIPELRLPCSKSIAHRNLLLYYLHNIPAPEIPFSVSRDTQLFSRSFQQEQAVFDFLDAGTPARFSLCFHAFTDKPIILTGNKSLKRRSIKDLVDTLRIHGAVIEYLHKDGYFPVHLHKGIDPLLKEEWVINTQETSQFISALLLCMSILPLPKKLFVNHLDHSWSYIRLSTHVLKKWGFQVTLKEGYLEMGGSLRTPENPYFEIDWGSASFMYLMVLLTQNPVCLIGAEKQSEQSDVQIIPLFQKLGIVTEFNELKKEALLRPSQPDHFPSSIDGSDFPDLIPVLISACIFKNIELTLTGIDNLKTKESNRIESIEFHVRALGWSFNEVQHGQFLLKQEQKDLPSKFEIKTFGDHRIAMAFAPWAAHIEEVYIDDVECVEKSFPEYWEAMKMCNFEVINHTPRVI